ncbi:MAG: hypothetical protein WKG06_01305 [Segetibacter sp.]
MKKLLIGLFAVCLTQSGNAQTKKDTSKVNFIPPTIVKDELKKEVVKFIPPTIVKDEPKKEKVRFTPPAIVRDKPKKKIKQKY